VLGQTCGLPLVGELAGRVALVGAPDYGLPGCPPGWYRSAAVVRADDRRKALEAFRGARLAINGADSQSGWGSILHHAAPLAEGGRFFGSVVVSGAHAASVPLVAAGAADLAAIDFVSWRYAQRFLPAAARLRVLMLTEPTPGVPYIAAAGTDTGLLADAVEAGIAGTDADTRAELGLVGFARLEASAYGVIARRFATAIARLPADVALA
jgi:ABC-type phosphate/phosphonate transport system substrate-binding protein